MADPTDPVSRRYRDAAREEPPAAIDAAILEAARTARPARFARWAGPVSIAAVLVLGIGVSLRMQTERPPLEEAAPATAPAPARTPETTQAPAAPPPATMQAAPPPRREKRAAEPSTFQAPAADAMRGEKPARAAAAQEAEAAADPARELERIAALRRDGRHDEADRALEAFRRAYPGYTIPEATWARVRPR